MYVIHYWELALKKWNRRDFERQLQKNINRKLANLGNFKVQRKYGKFILPLKENEWWIMNNEELITLEVKKILKKTPGIHHFSKADVADLDMDSMKKALDDCIFRIEKDFESFRITTTRTNKNFPINSMEVSRELGAYVLEKHQKKVNLHSPDKIFYVNISEKNVYIYSEKIAGIGGLPIGSSGRVITLLSGGIDSPIAAYQMMKRGCEVIAVHAYAKTLNPEKVKEKVLALAWKLAEVQGSIQVYFIPYGRIQSEIIQWADPKYRMLLFKRSIMRLANKIAKKVDAKVVSMWDAVWQVASQTLENIQCIYAESKLPVLSPLICYDKQEIIDLAKNVGTYEISIQPHEDCCSLIAWDKAWTSGRIDVLEEMESEMMIDVVEENVLGEIEMLNVKLGMWA